MFRSLWFRKKLFGFASNSFKNQWGFRNFRAAKPSRTRFRIILLAKPLLERCKTTLKPLRNQCLNRNMMSFYGIGISGIAWNDGKQSFLRCGFFGCALVSQVLRPKMVSRNQKKGAKPLGVAKPQVSHWLRNGFFGFAATCPPNPLQKSYKNRFFQGGFTHCQSGHTTLL